MICQKCGKRDFDTSFGCANPKIISPCIGDWICSLDINPEITRESPAPVVNIELFFLVWCPSGQRPPSYRHSTFEKALKEAQRLSGLNPGCNFFVLSCAGGVSTNQTYQIVRHFDDDIPF